MPPLADRRFLIFVDDVYEDLELWYPKLRLIEAGARYVEVTVRKPHVALPQVVTETAVTLTRHA